MKLNRKRFEKKKVLTLLIINLLIFLLVFAALESYIRIAYPALRPVGNESRKFWQYDSLLGWSHPANSNDIQEVKGYNVQVSINAKNLRDDEYEYERNSKRRILVLGDSYAWGFGVKKENRLTDILETRMNRTEIINAAIPGYSTDQQLLYYVSEGYKYNPDLVLVIFYENDFVGNSLDNIHWYNKPFYQIKDDTLVLCNVPVPEQSSYQKLRKFLSGKSYLISFILTRITIINTQSYSDDEGLTDSSADLTVSILTRLFKMCKNNKTQFALVSLPMPIEKSRVLKMTAEKYGFQFLDLAPQFENRKDYLIKGDGHWNEKGNKIAANSIYNWLNKTKIPGDSIPLSVLINK